MTFAPEPEELSSTTSAPTSAPISEPPPLEPRARKKAQRFEYSPREMQALRKAISEDSIPRLALYFLDYILRAQSSLFEQIHSRQNLTRISISMAILCAFLSGIYGFSMGIHHGTLQAASSAFKLPLLFLVTALFCVPSLYTFNVLLGQRFRFMQTVALMTTTLGTTTILLASLAPISLFFTLTTNDRAFLLLMHVAICGLCGIYGVRYLYRGCTYIAFRMEQPLNTFLLRMWITIYAIVGMQLSWRLRPFLGGTAGEDPFVFLRSDIDGNFFTAVLSALARLSGL